jgi:hypothetical protein
MWINRVVVLMGIVLFGLRLTAAAQGVVAKTTVYCN